MIHTSARRLTRQKGSALLIVFVFAAMLAIMLYKEMPVVAFEAQRQKEQLLIDRGNEYKRAVKLYVRKFQTFPPSMEALENTNRMRFLRNRYIDPFTGKDDWRLLHAGPGGIIIDSKIKKNQLGPGGVPGAPGVPTTPTSSTASSSSFGTPFGSSSFGSSVGFAGSTNANAQSSSGPNGQPTQVIPLPMRPPAMPTSGAAPFADGSMPQDSQSAEGQMQAAPDSGQASPPFPMPGPGGARFRNGTFGDPNNPAQTDGTAQDPQAMLQAMLQNQNNPQQAFQQPSAFNNTGNNNGANINGAAGGPNVSPSTFGAAGQNIQNPSQMGQMGNGQMGGGIAGVASKSAGHTIKVVKEQTDRSLWEFVYDMQAEANANAPGLGNPNGTAPNGAINATQGTQGSQTGFNSPNQNNSFGSGFGNSPAQPSMPPPTNP
jgi:hypothetical protein